jgi:transcriptional regulator with GAF, ATPase, and Fis domain
LPARALALDLMPLGMLVMLLCQIVIMAERWGGAIQAAEDTSSELRQLLDVNIAIASEIQLEALLQRIVKVTSQIIRADRSSLFLYDERTHELWSMVAEGVEGQEIRFSASAGLAGECFTTGEPINVTDAYADKRFNPSVDKATAIVTRCSCRRRVTRAASGWGDAGLQPARRRRVRRRRHRRISAFAAQAAVAIENATLFGEVAAERNYNDSILRSMSSAWSPWTARPRGEAERRGLRDPGRGPAQAADPETQRLRGRQSVAVGRDRRGRATGGPSRSWTPS